MHELTPLKLGYDSRREQNHLEKVSNPHDESRRRYPTMVVTRQW